MKRIHNTPSEYSFTYTFFTESVDTKSDKHTEMLETLIEHFNKKTVITQISSEQNIGSAYNENRLESSVESTRKLMPILF